ncbi:MAG: indole-3-glycerol phosphate synthase TrpC [Deltaproteobacteria bacterium]
MILDLIVERKKQEVADLRRHKVMPPEESIPPPRGFSRALTGTEGIAIIAEAKKASPSKGVIRVDFDPVAIARNYLAGGATAMSVLTDKHFFAGDLQFIPMVRAAVPLPVLRKDFIIDPLQIEEAAAYGADAVLLIAAILEVSQILDFRQMAEEIGMDVLVEVHDEYELENALAAGSRLIGVNNRNLKDFSVDLETTFRIKKQLAEGIPLVSESGIRNRDDLKRLAAAGVTAALIGETLMRSTDEAQALRTLLGGL